MSIFNKTQPLVLVQVKTKINDRVWSTECEGKKYSFLVQTKTNNNNFCHYRIQFPLNVLIWKLQVKVIMTALLQYTSPVQFKIKFSTQYRIISNKGSLTCVHLNQKADYRITMKHTLYHKSCNKHKKERKVSIEHLITMYFRFFPDS